MKKLHIIGLTVGIAMLTQGAGAQEPAQSPSPEMKKKPQAAALDNLMAVVGKQLDTAGQELKTFLQKSKGDMIEGAINTGIDQMAAKLKATAGQVAKIRPILRKDVEVTGQILDDALSVGLAAARASLKRDLDRQWKDVRAQLSEVLTDAQLEKADALNAELEARMVALFEPKENKSGQKGER